MQIYWTSRRNILTKLRFLRWIKMAKGGIFVKLNSEILFGLVPLQDFIFCFLDKFVEKRVTKVSITCVNRTNLL